MFVAEKKTKLLERWTPADLNQWHCWSQQCQKEVFHMTFLESGTSFGWKDKMLSADAVLAVMLRCWKVSTNGVIMLWTLVDPCGPFSQATMVIRSCAEEMGKLDSVAGKAALKSFFWLAKIGGERSECVRGGYFFFFVRWSKSIWKPLLHSSSSCNRSA